MNDPCVDHIHVENGNAAAIDSPVRPNGYVYALMEGSGLWGSSTMGNASIAPNPATPSLGVALLMDPARVP